MSRCLCLARGCARLFEMPWPKSNYCPDHRVPRVVPVPLRNGNVIFAMETRNAEQVPPRHRRRS